MLAVRVAHESEKETLIEMDPAVFFTEPHYDGYAAILVRLPVIELDLLDVVLTQRLALAGAEATPRRG